MTTGPLDGYKQPVDPRSFGLDRPSDPEPDPFAELRGQTSGSLETDSQEEVSALSSAFKSRANRERDRFRRATDSEYWVCICFDDRDAKDRFLRDHNLTDLGNKYLDGEKVRTRLDARG